MPATIEKLVNRTMANLRWSAVLTVESQAIRRAAARTRQQARVLCRFTALERQRRGRA